MSRIGATFARLKAEGRTGLVPYVTAGDPDLTRSADILRALDEAGADVLEVGVPFSDPLADGPVIQRASERARAAGGSLKASLKLVAQVRGEVRAPIVIFTYLNPVLRLGAATFAASAADAGVDGALILDLPIEEAGEVYDELERRGLDAIFLVSPTTSDERIRRAAELGRGFLYAISRLGVTGARDEVASDARRLVERIRAFTALPVAIGFGISRPEQVAEVGRWADAAVVGSALVQRIEELSSGDGLLDGVRAYVRWLRSATAVPAR